MRHLGIDYGSKKVGLALSDEAGTMGFPKGIVQNTPQLADELVALIEKENVEAIVIGESIDFSGAENPIAAYAHALGDVLAARTGLPVAYEAEFFTSVEARRQHQSEEKTRRPLTHPNIDDSAAALILTSYLSKHHG